MTLHVPFSLRPTRAALGVRWLVLIVIMVGAIISSIGLTSSHGLAAISAEHQMAPLSPEDSHGHSHGDQGNEVAAAGSIVGAEHPHHAVDHSHDKAHALPLGWSTAAPPAPSWRVLVRPWIEMVQASRLERPPMV